MLTVNPNLETPEVRVVKQLTGLYLEIEYRPLFGPFTPEELWAIWEHLGELLDVQG